MKRVVKGRTYTYQPAGWDIFDPRVKIAPGTRVRVVHPHGCPPPNTMGHAHVEDADTGRFVGLVSVASLTPTR